MSAAAAEEEGLSTKFRGLALQEVSNDPWDWARRFIADDSAAVWGKDIPSLVDGKKKMADFADYDDAARSWWRGVLAKVEYGQALFADPSRVDAMARILRKAHALNKHELSGQRACFVITGPRGVGKTAFVVGLLVRIAAHSAPTTLVIRHDLKSNGLATPKELIDAQLRKALPPGVDIGSDLSATIHLLERAKAGVIIFYDEFEELYARKDEASVRMHRQLHSIGSIGCHRNIMVIASGSSSVLRKLVFAIDGHDGLSAKYPLYGNVSSLNDSKYVALLLRPLASRESVADAVLRMSETDRNFGSRAVAHGIITEATPAQIVPENLDSFAMQTRGIVRFFDEYFDERTDSTGTARLERRSRVVAQLRKSLLKGSVLTVPASTVFEKLFTEWKRFCGGDYIRDALDFQAVARFRVGLQVFVSGLEGVASEKSVQFAHEATDTGLLWFDDSELTVEFLAPTDPLAYMMANKGPEGQSGRGDATLDPGELSDAEKLSLIEPKLASADELNEQLVLESLVAKSKSPEGLVIAGVAIKGLALSRPEYRYFAISDDTLKVSRSALARCSAMRTFFKEFPDEFGADGIALVPPRVLLRVQIKLSRPAGSKHTTSLPEVREWMEKMKENGSAISNALAEQLQFDSAPTPFNVLWVSWPCNKKAMEFLRAQQADTLVVERSNMMAFWCERVRKFVSERKLTTYGYMDPTS